MADDDRTRRRLSDATRSRIDDLASGWSVDGAPADPAAAAAPEDPQPRKKQRTIPPPAPGSPERKAFEQTIVAASGDERDDATDVLPPKRPTGAQPVVATRPARGDETQETPPPKVVATPPANDDDTHETPKIVATTRPREDVTEELLDLDPSLNREAAGNRSRLASATPAAARSGPAASGADPRSTQPGAPPPPPGRGRRFTHPPMVGEPSPVATSTPPAGDRSRSMTGPQPIVGARTKATTGQVPMTRDASASGVARARTVTGPQAIIPDIPMRPRTSTGQVPVVARPRAATGQHAIIPTRSQTPSGQYPTVGSRTRTTTGQQPIIGDARGPGGEQPIGGTRSGVPGAPPPTAGESSRGPRAEQLIGAVRARNATGQQPIVASSASSAAPSSDVGRTSSASGPQPVVGDSVRTRSPSAQPPAIGARNPFGNAPPPPSRSRRMTGEQPDVVSRTHAGTGPHAIVPARTRMTTDSQPIVVDRSKTPPSPIASGRAQGGTGPQPIVPARNKESTGEQPIVRRSQPLSGPYAAMTAASSGPHGVVEGTIEPSGTAPHSGVPSGRASGSVPPPTPLATPRTKTSTRPPPPPGSPERLAAERSKPASAPPTVERSSAFSTQPLGSADRSKRASAQPATERSSAFSTQPLGSADRRKPVSSPPPAPHEDRSKPTSSSERSGAFPVVPFSSADRSKPASAPPASERSAAFATLRGGPERAKPASAPPWPASGSHMPSDRFEDDQTNPGPPPSTIDDEPSAPARSKPTSIPPPTAIAVPPLVMSTSAITNVAESRTSGPQYPRASNDGPSAPFATETRTFSSEPRTPAVIVDVSLAEARPAPAPVKQTVPTGEFDSGVQTVEDTTNPRDAAEALLSVPQTVTPVEDLLEDDEDDDQGEPVDLDEEDDEESGARQRPLHAAPDPSTEKFERGDPTQDAPPDAPEVARLRVKHPTGGTLRASAQLRRKRGRWGDVRYVATAIFGVRRARQELGELEHRQGLRQTSRRRHLITLGRTAAVMDNFDHPALGKAREQLAAIEDERSKHAGAVAASDAELERVRRDRDNNAGKYAIAISEADAELVELAAKLEPVEKEAVAVRKRAADLREELHRIEKQISDAEASLASPKNEKLDRAAVAADIATYKANKVAVLRDEPIIATELDALNPRIAAMEATRVGLQKKKAELDKAEQEDQRRTLELLEAIGAKRKVVERAAADAEAARDNALFELGECLYVDRSPILTAQLSPIDQIDLEIGEGERRTMELKEILSNIDKAKFARGLAIMILAAGALASLAYFIASAAL